MNRTLQSSNEQTAINLSIPKQSIALIALSVCVGASAQPGLQGSPDVKITQDMCATIAFRKNNEKICNELEASVKPRATVRGSNPSSVPTTSPNYGKATKS